MGRKSHTWAPLKGAWHKIFSFRFFLESVSRAPEYPIEEIWIFMKIRWDIREWMPVTSVNDTGDRREKCWDIKFFIFCYKVVGVHFTSIDKNEKNKQIINL